MNLKNKILDLSVDSQCCIEKAKNLAELMLQNIDNPSMCQTCTCFIKLMLETTDKYLEDIELNSFKL